MLHFYEFSNFQSFRDKTVVSCELNQKVAEHGWQVQSPSGNRTSTVLAVMGANGAGKTSAIKVLAFIDWFVAHSFTLEPTRSLPMHPYALTSHLPTDIALEASDGEGTVWRYELSTTTSRVLREALYRKVERFNYVFVREWDEAAEAYKIKQQGFGFNSKEASKVRQNASLISTAAQYGVPLALQLTEGRIIHNMNVAGRLHFNSTALADASQTFSAKPTWHELANSLLAAWDLGLSGIEIVKEEKVQADGTKVAAWRSLGKHATPQGSFKMPIELESSGTQAAFVLLARLLPVLEDGGLAVIDELDNDLHPHMLEPILDLFANPTTNPKKGQLIFTCHTPEVLDLLQKSQVLFVDKVECSSHGYRADEVKGLRADDNLRAKYLAGALGGVPRF